MATSVRRYRWAAMAAAVLWLAARGFGQQPADRAVAPTFRSAADVVTLRVTVLDRQRRPIRGLTAADFTVVESGDVRPIVGVEATELPAEPPGRPVWDDRVPHDVVDNAPLTGRLLVVFFDRSIDRGWPTERARIIARRAIEQLGVDDSAAVVYNYHLATPVNFTRDRQRLLASIDSPVIGTQAYDPSGQQPSCLCNLCGIDMITRVSELMESATRRQKILLYIGGDLPIFRGPGMACAPSLLPATHAMFAAAQRAQVVIHAIDPAGLVTNRRSHAGWESLQRLTEETGGRAVVNSNAPDARVPLLFEESRVSYLVGFVPRSTTPDGQLHGVRVQVRGEGRTVLAPTGYRIASPVVLAADGSATSAGGDAVAALAPIPDVDLRAASFAVPDPKNPASAAIATVLRIASAGSVTARSRVVHVVVTAFDTEGRAQASHRQSVTLAPVAGTSGFTYEVLSRFALPRGRYEIRAVVEEEDPRRVGSVFSLLDVEDFSRATLAVSGLAFHSTLGPRTLRHPSLDAWLPLEPTTERAFARNAGAVAFLRVVKPTIIDAAGLQVTTQIVDSRGRRVTSEATILGPLQFEANGAADYTFSLPLATLATGDYLLTVDIKGRTTVSRSARFSVR